jgi:hypothetical protein
MTAVNKLRLGTTYGPVSIGSVTNNTLSGSGLGIAWVAFPETTDPITHIGFRYGARTGTPPTYSVRIEALDGSGDPTGTDIGGASPTATNWTPPADASLDGTWVWIALTNSYTPTNLVPLAFVIRYGAGTIDASNCSSITMRHSTIISPPHIPYSSSLSAGSWTKAAGNTVAFAWKTATNVYGWPAISGYTTATASTAGHRSGMFFTLPIGTGTSYKISALNFLGSHPRASGSYKVGIYNTSWTEMQSVTIDGDHNSQPGITASRSIYAAFASPATLSYGTKYYAAMETVSGSFGVSMNGILLGAANDRLAFPNGENRGLVTFDGTTTTENTLIMPQCELILSDITVPSGGGAGAIVIGNGGSVIRGMA